MRAIPKSLPICLRLRHDPVVDDTWVPNAALMVVRAEMYDEVRKDNEKVARQLKSESKIASKRIASTEVPRGAEDDVKNQRLRLLLDTIGFERASYVDSPLDMSHDVYRNYSIIDTFIQYYLYSIKHLTSLPLRPPQSAESLAEPSTAPFWVFFLRMKLTRLCTVRVPP